jgi:acyl-coenzyme A synthetase/AMP-(fatty) acid ligase
MESEAQQVSSWMTSLPEFRATIKAETPFEAVSDIIPPSDESVIWGTDPSKRPLTFNELRKFVAELDLRQFGLKRSDTLCTAIPNGPEAAVSFMAFMTQCVFAPLNPALTVPEIEFELHDLPAAAMIVMRGDAKAALVEECCKANNVPVIHMEPSDRIAGLFTLSGPPASRPSAFPTKAADLGLVLHTSARAPPPPL